MTIFTKKRPLRPERIRDVTELHIMTFFNRKSGMVQHHTAFLFLNFYFLIKKNQYPGFCVRVGLPSKLLLIISACGTG
jgi:hypothetical protein